MNKEIIYIEASDDITKILSAIKSSEKKIIALVPPKHPSVLLSSVNIKLISRTARSAGKTIVIVTKDDSLTKLAMSAKIPVAPTLKSRPVLSGVGTETKEEVKSPEKEEKPATEPSPEAKEEFLDEPEISKLLDDEEETEDSDDSEDVEQKSVSPREKSRKTEDVEELEDDEDESEEDEEEEKPAQKKSKKEKKKEPRSGFAGWVSDHKIWVISGSVIMVCVVVFLVWAFIFAPSVDISIKVRTAADKFSENITITKDTKEEKTESGVFLAHIEKKENEQSIKFTATGQKDLGESASGSLVVYYQSPNSFSFNLPEGSVFTYNGLEYVSLSSGNLFWDGKKTNVCDNKDDYEADVGCQMSVSISIKASAPGEKYNVTGRQKGWSSKDYPSLTVYNSSDISGGTSKLVTIVQQSDVDSALDKLKSDNQTTIKEELMKGISDSVLPVDASFRIETTDPVVTPAVGQEVPDGTTPNVTSKTTASIMTLELAKIEEFIKGHIDLGENQRLYSYGEPFIEYFTQSDENTYTGKLKTNYKYGPQISESEVLDKIRGKKIGRVEPDLKSEYPGIASVDIDKSYFWVSSIPKDPNHVKIKMEVEE